MQAAAAICATVGREEAAAKKVRVPGTGRDVPGTGTEHPVGSGKADGYPLVNYIFKDLSRCVGFPHSNRGI